jgi:hypothetical protein
VFLAFIPHQANIHFAAVVIELKGHVILLIPRGFSEIVFGIRMNKNTFPPSKFPTLEFSHQP